jgi:hypothetical protein
MVLVTVACCLGPMLGKSSLQGTGTFSPYNTPSSELSLLCELWLLGFSFTLCLPSPTCCPQSLVEI